MRRQLAFVVASATFWTASLAAEGSWIFLPSYYSHDPSTGARVAQFVPEEVALATVDPTYLRSGYRHNRVTIRGAGGTADRLHMVETWGEGERIRPYGEWLRPFREGATPYGPWGNPQGPWTTPFGAWVNPYGLGRIPQVYDFNYRGAPYPHGGPYYPSPYGPPGGHPGPGPGGYGPGPGGHGPGGGEDDGE